MDRVSAGTGDSAEMEAAHETLQRCRHSRLRCHTRHGCGTGAYARHGARLLVVRRWPVVPGSRTGASSVAQWPHLRGLPGPRRAEKTRETPLEQAGGKSCRTNSIVVQLGYALSGRRQLDKDHIQITQRRKNSFE